MGSDVSGGGRGLESACERAGVWGAGEEDEGPASDSVPVSPVGTASTGSSSVSGSGCGSASVGAPDDVSIDVGRD